MTAPLSDALRSAQAARRAALRAHIDGPVLLMGNSTVARNIPMNRLPFRQDSSFLYFTGCTSPDAALLLDGDRETLFLAPPAPDDALWHGHITPIEETAAGLGFATVRPIDELESACFDLAQRPRTLAVSGPQACARAAALSGTALSFGQDHGDASLVDAVIQMRRRLDSVELEQMREAAAVTSAAHQAAMGATAAGRYEREVGAIFDGVIAAAGMVPAYESIVTVRGEVLHNHARHNVLRDGQLLLLDGGAEAPMGYATDVTRTWPVSGRFTPRQKDVYEAVLEAQLEAIARCTVRTRYREVHLTASRVLARFLLDAGLLRNTSVDAAVERGAHALFFPHGVGHLLGLDVHDLENFGDLPAYPAGRSRSAQFGLSYLRLDRDLEAGNVVTVEPGFYVVPAILADERLTAPLADIVDLAAAREWVGFGGIRIEDDIHVTAEGPEVVTAGIPKTVAEVEAVVGAAVAAQS